MFYKIMFYLGLAMTTKAIMVWDGASLYLLIIGLAMIGTGYHEGKYNERRGKM